MFKKLFSVLAVMMLLGGMNSAAQELQKSYLGKVTPKFANKTVMTSQVELKGSEFWTGYWNGVVDENTQMVGVQQVPMDYGAAVRYPAGSAITADKVIEGIKFSFPDATNIANVKVFISTSIPNTAEQADICYQEVTDLTGMQNYDDPFNEVRFDKPYKVDSSKDVYVGYFFSVTGGGGNAEKFPVLIQPGTDKKDAMWLSFGGEAWADYYGNGFGVLAMQILMSGEFADNDASIVDYIGTFTGSKGSFDLPLVVENAGNNGIENLTVETMVGDVKTTVDVNADNKVTGIGNQFAFTAKINTPETTGNYDITVKIVKVNGEEKAEPAIGKGKMLIISRIVDRKVLFEEFTGMWCGWCPRGMVALEKISQVYGDKVTKIAVHNGDALECKDYNKIVGMVSGFPGAIVDRAVIGADPYYGTSQDDFGIKEDIDNRLEIAPIAEVKAQPALDGDVLTATAEVTFLYTGDASNYNVGYVITHDGMENSKWAQANNYAQFKGQGLEDVEPLFEPWVNGKSQVKNVVYGEVAIAAKGISNGIQGSLPYEVEEDVAVTYSEDIDLSLYKKIQDFSKLNLVVILFDAETGEVVNTDIASLEGCTTGISEVAGEKNSEEVARYTVDGARINGAQKGVNIVKYADGTVKKVLVK